MGISISTSLRLDPLYPFLTLPAGRTKDWQTHDMQSSSSHTTARIRWLLKAVVCQERKNNTSDNKLAANLTMTFGSAVQAGRLPPATPLGLLTGLKSSIARWYRLAASATPCHASVLVPPEFQRGRVPSLFKESYLVDPASSHMLVSKIKPCMSKYKWIIQ